MTFGENKNMTIIGGTRGLGRWIAEHLKQDFNITITSRNKNSGQKVAKELNVKYNNNNVDAIKNAEIIIFSVPIDQMVKTIKEVAPHAQEGSLLMDITSIKKEASEALEKYAPENVEILPCHPMFGPRVSTLEGQIIILTPIENRSKRWFPRVTAYLEKLECEIVLTTPQEHDKTMAIVQGLTHFSYINLASTMKKLNVDVKKSRLFASPTYSLMLDIISGVAFQNPYLYYSIQKSNYETSIVRETLIKEGMYLSELIENGDEEDFVKIMTESARYLDENEEGLGRLDKTIDMLTHQADYLKKSINEEVGLQHIYTKKIYVGTLKEITSQSIVLEDNNQEQITLKLSDVYILPDNLVYEWKKNNLKIEHFTLEVTFPSTCDEKYIIKMFKNIEPVIDAKITNVYKKPDNLLNTYTIAYSVFNANDKDYIEEYIKGIGGNIQ